MKRILSVLLSVIVCTGILLPCCYAQTAPEITAVSALVTERKTGTVLFEKDIDSRVYPASMTKIMTCLLALERLRLSDTVTVSATALENLDKEGSTAYLSEGEQLPVQDLLYCLMISSANEAANIVAENVSGSVPAFVELMNSRAAELGCTATHFANPHGLHDEDHYTTVRDLSKIAEAALADPVFRTICSTATYTVPATNLSEKRTLTTTNQLIHNKAGNPYYDSRVTGVKTGFTTPAGRCLIASAEDENLSLLSIVCGCPTKILEDGNLEFGSFTDTKLLLDYAFSSYTYTELLNTLYPITEVPVFHANSASSAPLAPCEKIRVLLPVDYAPEKITYDISLTTPEGIEAPITAGEVLGTVTAKYEDTVLGTVELITIADIARAALFSRGNALGTVLLILLIGLLIIAVVFLCISSLRSRRRGKRQHSGGARRMEP